jgi:hypothetical protein
MRLRMRLTRMRIAAALLDRSRDTWSERLCAADAASRGCVPAPQNMPMREPPLLM